MLEFDAKQIRYVTAQGIVHVDDSGVEQFIDFLQCYQNHIKARLSTEGWERHKELNNRTDEDWDKYVESVIGFTEVGIRNIMAPPWGDGPFIEFHTQPPTRFRFAADDEFRTVRSLVDQTRWRTHDLS